MSSSPSKKRRSRQKNETNELPFLASRSTGTRSPHGVFASFISNLQDDHHVAAKETEASKPEFSRIPHSSSHSTSNNVNREESKDGETLNSNKTVPLLERRGSTYSTLELEESSELASILKELGAWPPTKEGNHLDSYLPLQAYYDRSKDPVTIEQVEFPVQNATALILGEWRDCVVSGARQLDGGVWVFLVEPLSQQVKAKVGGKAVELGRVEVLFPWESRVAFAKRYARAVRLRHSASTLLRYNLYIDCMPKESAQEGGSEARQSEEQLERIIRAAMGGSGNALRDAKARIDVSALLQDVENSYVRTLNKIDFDIKLGSSSIEALRRDGLEELPAVLDKAYPSKETPYKGCLTIPAYDVEHVFNSIQSKCFLAESASLAALDKVHVLCQNLFLEPFALFCTTTNGESLRFSEFDEIQRLQIDHVTNRIRDDWTHTIKNSIKKCLAEDTADRWHLDEKNRANYEASDLKRLFVNVNLRMEDSLRDFIVKNVEKYSAFVLATTNCKVTVKSISVVDVQHLAKGPLTMEQKLPLFRIEVVEELRLPKARTPRQHEGDEHAGEEEEEEEEEHAEVDEDMATEKLFFGYSEDLEKFAQLPQTMLSHALHCIQEIPQVQRLAMDRIYWTQIPYVSVVSPEEEWVQETQEKLHKSVSTAFRPLHQYLAKFDEFLEFLRLDVDAFMHTLEEPFIIAEEKRKRRIEKEERRAQKLKEKLEREERRLREQEEAQGSDGITSSSGDTAQAGEGGKEAVSEEKQNTQDERGDAGPGEEANEEEEEEEEEDDDDDDDNADTPVLNTDLIANYISTHLNKRDELEKRVPSEISLGAFMVDCEKLKKKLIAKHEEIVQKLLDFVNRCTVSQCSTLLLKYADMNKELSKYPHNIEELVAMKDYINTIPNKLSEIHEEIAKLWRGYDLLDQYNYRLPTKVFSQKWKLFGGTKMVLDKVDVTTAMLEKEKINYAKIQEEKQEEFWVDLDKLSREVASFSQYSDLRRVNSIAQNAADIAEKIREAQAKADLFNSRETLFEKELTDYEQVVEIGRAFQPYEIMWATVKSWVDSEEKWMKGKFNELVPEEMEKQVTESYKLMNRSIKFFQKAELPLIKDSAEVIKDKIEKFRPYMPMITALRNQGMRDRHYEKISEDLGFTIDPSADDFSLVEAIRLKLHEHSEVIAKVSGVAAKEFQIEQSLQKMRSEWEHVILDCRAYKDTGTYVLGGIDEIIALLDEHLTLTQAMQFSSFKGPFVEQIDEFDSKLSTTSEVIEEWIAVQRNWLYLQPIFESPDIAKQLPAEAKRFQSVDKNWRTTLLQASKGAKALEFCSNPKLLEMFSESNKLLDMVSKGLSDYLETKRGGFSRFYFLSNDELLEILSETKDPTMVQPHLKKCFEGIRSVFFNENMHITDMKSSEGEVVPLNTIVNPEGKNVEVWMTELEERMMDSVKKVMWESMLSYVEMARTDWLQVVPGQCALNASQFHWTREIEESLDAEGNSGVGKCFDQQVRQINDMVALVRDPELKSNARMTISALTVIDVHARDVTEKLFKEGVQTRHDFLWISQMRYYWQEGEALEGDMKVMMVSSLRPYGYEYLGNSFRLVITPLTDKCYLTLMGALQMNLGGAPAGPAGTGKTETTKDLAKALAKQCVVFNCSDGLDYLAMGKFFKGLASCGAWACFDEFNRIDVEVLSVVAQQIMTLQAGVSAGLTRIVFEGVEIRLSDQFAVYITMNPGYAGRTELPDNLKALFRPVAMMVPDYALIGEIMLYSFGYEKARICAKKMVATFQLCSEQLSSQPHYDYGMRAVKTVIVAAGNLRRDYPNEDEEILLLRALQDVNLPKFLSFDLPLFKGIISDLFPGKSRPDIDYGALLECLRIVNESTGLQNTPWFLQKQIQLYETIVVRHGLMLVGPTGGGKSRNVENLDAALTMLKKRGVKGFAYEKVHRHTVNPKSITMGQLYGEFDPNTHEWQDGILANIVRICAKSTTPDRKWVMFDGPVDAIWIENMNTVLDDNKKLCLNSGEIMALSAEMTMMFEVEDLAVASPATVSRVGVIYMEPATLGSDPVIQSWIEYRLPTVCTLEHKTRLQILFDTYLQSAITVLRRRLFEPVPTVTNNVVQSLMRVMDSLFHYHLVLNAATGSDANNDDDDGPAKGKSSGRLELDTDLEPLFFFSLVWSVCCTTDTAGRRTFDGWLRNKMDQNCSSFSFPREGMIYDYVWDIKTHSWVGWMDTIEPYKYDRDLPFAETIIPTSDSVCYTYLLDILLRNNQHVLMCGDTGTGKSININRHLSSGMPSEYIPINMAFSAQTSANQTQDLLDSKMEKRRKGVFGPPAGKQFLIFVDDLNMPKRETYFAQPPIELLRQWFTYGGWYDRKTLQFRKIIDVSMVAAMGPPGGGRNPVTPRLLRHYNIITYTPLEQASMMTIFGTILSNFLKDGFDSSVLPLAEPIVDATIHIYNTIREELLPTPSKSHYTFNMRDLSKVFQGMLMVSSKVTDGVAPVVRLWVHEASRVFRDRLVNDEDRQWFDRLVVKCVDQFLNLDWETKIKPTDSEYLIFGDLLEPDSKVYQHVEDVNSLLPAVEQYLNEYNAESKSPMNLKLFMDAIQHISRIARVIRQPMGNALLLGVGGSGRKSLSRLAAYIGDFQLFQVEISKGYGLAEWREDIKSCLLKAGVEDIQVVFLFDDTQIVFSQMLEDINGILNQGDVPNLYPPEDMEKIMTACRGDCAKRKVAPTKINIFASFINRVKRNVHVVMCMSPGTPIFRDRLRMFPSLVNCCTIDWFSEWPDEALQSVGMGIMQEVDLQLGDKLSDVVELFRVFHQSVAVKSKEFFDELRRYNYVTPTSYLELLNTFKALLQQKRDEVLQKKHRLQVGLDKLTTTAAQVAELQIQLTEMQPVLAKTQVEVDEMIVQLKKDKAAADETMQIVSVEEKAAQEKAMATQAIADDAQRDLDEALPALDEAVKCLSKLKKADIVEVASLKTPPSGVKLTMEAACIMFQVKPKMVADPNNMGKKLKDYWEPAQKNLLSDANKLLSQLFNFDKDNIPEKVIREIEPYIESSEFQPKEIEKASKACTAICMWVRAMHMYHYVAKAVEPKREKLREAQAELDVTMAKLQKSRDELKKVMDRIQELEDGYQQTLAKKEQLAQDVEQCSARLDRAHKLIGGLGGEKDRWTASVQQFDIDYVNLLGDVLIASGCIAYLGPFTSTYRASLVKKWTSILSELDIPHSPETNMIRTLGNAVEIRSWQVSGLPADNHSTENAIVIKKARRWPLLIDPQTQANRFIKNLGKESANGIEVTKASNRNFLRQLENGVRFGKWVLLESVGEKLDAALEPILLQQVFKQDGQMMIKLGDNTVPYHEDFRFFMTTKLPNPHYPPEVSVKVSLLNFSITPLGLEEQLLGLVMVNELPELEAKKNEIVVQNAAMGKQLQEIEDKILYMLSNSQGNILDDAELISTLADSKVTSQEINEKVAEAKETEVEIDNTRELYRSFATRGSILYFSIADLFVIDPMYQYSLQWFSGLFSQSILNSERKNDVDERLEILKEHFTYSLYENICRSLFESHKLLFAFNLCIRIMQAENLIDPSEWRFLLTGQAGKVDETDGVKKPSGQGGDWVTDKSWSEIRNLSTLPALHGFDKDFANHLSEWKHLFDSERCQEEPLPGDWETRLNDIQHMIVLRALRPDKLTESIQNFIIKYFGQQYIEPPPFDMKKCFDVSMVTTPLIFVLTSGSDPTKDFFQFAEQMGMADRTKSISLGQGQGPIAERMIEEGINKGSWVLLQNCHLCSSWMDTLEMIVEELNPDACHAEFRLWLTSMPTKTFPVSVLQIGIKMTKEPPKGMRANLKSIYYKFDDDILRATTKPGVYMRLLFGLCFFHALVQERRKFGPLGWNRQYEFNNTDLDISQKQLELYIDAYEEIPYDVLHFLTSYINYGGRITDAIDSRTADVILKDFFTPDILKDGYQFSPSGVYHMPALNEDAPHHSFTQYISSLPVNADPEVFGMHQNANISCALTDVFSLLDTLVLLQPRTSGGKGESREDVVLQDVRELLSKLPPSFDLEGIRMEYPTKYEDSMNTILNQEATRYEKLLSVIRSTLKQCEKALQGFVVMSAELEAMSDSMYNQKVPEMWEAASYPSMKPLKAWFAEFLDRVKFFSSWVENGAPSAFWISGFFFPQAFFTGQLQNYARARQIPINTTSFSQEYPDIELEDITRPPESGAYIYGLFVEGARWDKITRQLEQPLPKKLYDSMPVIHFKPEQNRQELTRGVYRMPLYKVLSRAGTLSTTGHSTNFITFFTVPASGTEFQNVRGQSDIKEWVKAGVACFCSLKF